MAVEVRLPLLGDVMQEGTLVEWLRADGASVERGAPDLTGVGGPQHPIRLLQTGYARQLHSTPNIATRWLSLNTRLPPVVIATLMALGVPRLTR